MKKAYIMKLSAAALALILLLGALGSCVNEQGGDHSETESDVVADSDLETVTDTDVERDTEADTEAESDTEKGSEAVLDSETDTDVKSDTETDTDTAPVTDGDTESDEGEKNEVPVPIVDDFDGYAFKVLTRKGSWESNDITASATGSTLDQAVFIRNETLVNKYNFKIVETKDPKWVETAKTQGQSGVHNYDMWSFRMNDMPSLGQEGFLYNLNEVDGINLDASYYDQSTRIQGSFANYLFFLTGDMIYNDEDATGAFFINHTIWNTAKLTDKYGKDIYQIVEDGEWTIERLEDACKVVKADIDGNGTYDENDQWGFARDGWLTLSMNIGMGNDLLQKDTDDVFVLNNSVKQTNDMQYLVGFLTSSYVFEKPYTVSTPMFNDRGTLLFKEGQLDGLPALSATDIDYGVLPYPKRDAEDQTDYYTFVSTYGSNCITIASTVSEVDKVANIIELTSYASQQTVKPKYIEFLFNGRVTQRVEDTDMLNIIFANRKYELCYLWSTGGLYSSMQALLTTEGPDVSATFKALETSVQESVERKLERIEQLS